MCEYTPLCGFASHAKPHKVEGTPKFVTSKRLLKYVKKVRTEFRPEYEVCIRCYNSAVIAYKREYESAMRKVKMKRQGNATLISAPSLSSHRTPLAQLQRLPASNEDTNINNEDSSNSSSSVASVVAFNIPSKDKQNQQDPQSSQSSLDTQPTTSADAARRLAKKNVNFAAVANVTQHVAAVPLVDDDDDVWSDDASPALLSGARLPHIQPILKNSPQHSAGESQNDSQHITSISQGNNSNNSQSSSKKQKKAQQVQQQGSKPKRQRSQNSIQSLDISLPQINAVVQQPIVAAATVLADESYKKDLYERARLAEMDFARREHEQKLRQQQMEQELKLNYYRKQEELKLQQQQMEQELKLNYYRKQEELKLQQLREEHETRMLHNKLEHEARMRVYAARNNTTGSTGGTA